jgi:hypothetical protein
MAQGIAIVFLNNPVEGNRIKYFAEINGVRVIYVNGLDIVDFEFTNNDSEILADPLHRVKIGSNTQDSANNVKLFLGNNGYSSTSIPIFNRALVDNDIWYTEITFGTAEAIYFDIDSDNANATITNFNNTFIPSLALKYFFQYKNVVNDEYRCEIYQKNYSGPVIEISGRATLEKGEVKNHFDPIRGTGLSLQLEASESLKLQDLYTSSERDFVVKFYRNSSPLFYGFVKPDGVSQSFTRSIWQINILCVDGLGYLEDLAFNDANGGTFTGKMSGLDIIYNCLKRTGLELRINTYIEVFFYSILPAGPETDVLAQMRLNVERFIKADDNTTMSCQEVLSSVLQLFNACITQDLGEWYIYRPTDLYFDRRPFFKRYEANNTYLGLNRLNLPRSIGNQINGFSPFHCSGNQQIEIRGAVSSFRLNYKYGFIASFMENGNLYHAAGTKIYDGWTVQNWVESESSGYLIIDPVSTNGISFRSAHLVTGVPYEREIALISDYSEELLQNFTFDFKVRFISYGFPVRIDFYVLLIPSDGGISYSLDASGNWVTTLEPFYLRNKDDNYPNNTGESTGIKYERTFTINCQPLPKDGILQILMVVPVREIGTQTGTLVDVKSIEVINTFAGNNIVGEFHTVSRIAPVSSIVKNNRSVNNGDNGNKVYTGAVYKEDGVTLTKDWYRRRPPYPIQTEIKPILRIIAEEELTIAQIPMQVFTGDLFGFSGYLAVYSIDNISGVFMPV